MRRYPDWQIDRYLAAKGRHCIRIDPFENEGRYRERTDAYQSVDDEMKAIGVPNFKEVSGEEASAQKNAGVNGAGVDCEGPAPKGKEYAPPD